MSIPKKTMTLVFAFAMAVQTGYGQIEFNDNEVTERPIVQHSVSDSIETFMAGDSAFCNFISPMTNLVYFEDPRQLSEIRPFFFHHKVPAAAGGGSVQLYGAQIRLKLTENMSFIAIKDGFITSSNALIRDGWADLAAGLKFTLIRDVQQQRLWSGGFTFEAPTGEASALQGNGHGELNLFLSGARAIAPNINFMTASGLRTPFNTTDESMSSYWSNHIDFHLANNFYFLMEANWYHWLQSGQDGLAGVEGLDVFNFGSTGVAGNDIVTSAIGFKYKTPLNNELGVAWEFPVTSRRDIIDNRLTVDMRWRF